MSTVQQLLDKKLIQPPKFLPGSVHYETIMGSVAYGVSSDTSDMDIYGFCVPPKDMVFPHLRGEIPGFGRQIQRFEQWQQHVFESETWHLLAVKPLKDEARRQLGTVGGGNHFVDLMADENGQTWTVTHFRSRGLGHRTATYFLNAGGTKDGMMVEPLVPGVSTALGYDYIQCMALAGEYAYAGRDWVIETVTG